VDLAPIVRLIGSLEQFDQRRPQIVGDGFGDFTADEARWIAAGLEEHVLPRLRPDERVRLDGTATDEPDDGTFHRTDDTTHLNYSVRYEDLVRLIEFCKTADGLRQPAGSRTRHPAPPPTTRLVCAICWRGGGTLCDSTSIPPHVSTRTHQMDPSLLSLMPSPDRPLLVGMLIDVSGSMVSSIRNTSGESAGTRLTSFRDAFDGLVQRAQDAATQGVGGAIAPLLHLFAYGFGFGNPLSRFMGDKGPNVRDLLDMGNGKSTVPIDILARDLPVYRSHLESQVTKMFGDTPMAAGFRAVRDRFRAERAARRYFDPPILFVLSDGEPTDEPSAAIQQIADELKREGVQIIACYVTDENVTEPRRLYADPLPNWPVGAWLMSSCASPISADSPFTQYFREFGWTADPGARLFAQINQSDVVGEFLNVVISPLQRPPGAGQMLPTPEPESSAPASIQSIPPESPPAPEAPPAVGEVNVFVSYSHRDAKYLGDDSLLGYLSGGLARERFRFWHDERIEAGELWDERIRKEIDRADVALVLVSQAFLNSRYCQDQEIERFLEARRKAGLRIVPVVLSPCDWSSYPWLAATQALPGGDETVETDYRDRGKRQRLFLEVLKAMRSAGEQVRRRSGGDLLEALGTISESFTRSE
jgi:hypothetical protein